MIGVVLCGGVGSRLWPLSRDLHPKPFLSLSSGRSLLEETYLRAIGVSRLRGLITTTNRELYFKVAETYRIAGSSLPITYILEPFGRNTAPAIAASALEAVRLYGQETILLVLSTDHLISDKEAFFRAVASARELAEKDRLVVFGIKPTKPAETGYGYIEADGDVVLRFIEKPAPEKAEEYSRADNYYWNAGIFCFKAKTVLDEMRKHSPDLLAAVEAAVSSAGNADADCIELHAEKFSLVPNISIDYATIEKSDRVSVVPCDIGWRDIGSWTAIAELIPPDSDGNRIQGQPLLRDTHGCVIHSEERLVCTIGVENLLIIDTEDALLVADVFRTQEIRHVYNALKEREHEAYRVHRTVYRPWGKYTILSEGIDFKTKRLEVNPGKSLSLQMHHYRSEHWVVVSGKAKVINGEDEFVLNVNESTYVPAGQKHRLENPGTHPLVIIEVQSGKYLGEDDIVRFKDSPPPPGQQGAPETRLASQNGDLTSRPKVYLALPAYNEEPSIKPLFTRISRFQKEFPYTISVIVYDDGCTDNTKREVLFWKDVLPIIYLDGMVNKGLGAGMSALLAEFAGRAGEDDILVVMDCDDTHDPAQVKQMLGALHCYQDADVVIASRYRSGATISGIPFHRMVMSVGAAALYKIIHPIFHARDYTCGYRAYRKGIIEKTFAMFGAELIRERGFACMVELLLKIRRAGGRIREIPLRLAYDNKLSSSKMDVSGNAIRLLRKLISWRIKGVR